MDVKKEVRSTFESYVEQQGADPNDPQVQSMLDEKSDEFDNWWESRPDWLQAGDDMSVRMKDE